MMTRQEQTNGLSFLGLSQEGESHRKSGKPNQDAVEFFTLEGAFLVAVSDGLGSCALSHIGSQSAMIICKQVLLEILDERLPFAPESISRRLAELWTDQFSKVVSKEYSTTLKAVFGYRNELVTISIGDGLLVVLSGDEVLTALDIGNGFVNETVCLSHGMKPKTFWSGKIAKRNGLLVFLSTDGISSGITEGREVEFVKQIAGMKRVGKLKNSLERMLTEISKYNADDKTVGIVRFEQQRTED
mgnify:CR=1 FL=1